MGSGSFGTILKYSNLQGFYCKISWIENWYSSSPAPIKKNPLNTQTPELLEPHYHFTSLSMAATILVQSWTTSVSRRQTKYKESDEEQCLVRGSAPSVSYLLWASQQPNEMVALLSFYK